MLIDIADEERVHAGEFARLIAILTGDEDDLLRKGSLEVDAKAAKIAGTVQAPLQNPGETTIGSLKSG